jgi:hypothetical protein
MREVDGHRVQSDLAAPILELEKKAKPTNQVRRGNAA